MLSYTGEPKLAFCFHTIWKQAQEWKYSKEHNEFLVYMLRTLDSLAFTGTAAPKSLTDAFLKPLHRPIIIKLCVYQILCMLASGYYWKFQHTCSSL